MKKCIHINIFTGKRQLQCPFQYCCRHEGLQFYKKGTPSQMCFVKFVKFYRNLNFTEDSLATASDFQQHFGHITCSINNKSTQSQLAVCLGPPKLFARAARKHFTVFVSKIFKITKVEGHIFCGRGCRNKHKRVLAEAVIRMCFAKKAF